MQPTWKESYKQVIMISWDKKEHKTIWAEKFPYKIFCHLVMHVGSELRKNDNGSWDILFQLSQPFLREMGGKHKYREPNGHLFGA